LSLSERLPSWRNHERDGAAAPGGGAPSERDQGWTEGGLRHDSGPGGGEHGAHREDTDAHKENPPRTLVQDLRDALGQRHLQPQPRVRVSGR